MPDPLHPVEQLHRELEVCEAATEGPWTENNEHYDDLRQIVAGDAVVFIEPSSTKGYSSCYIVTPEGMDGNFEFTILARTALPARIRDVLRLMELVGEYPLEHKAVCEARHSKIEQPGGFLVFKDCTCGLDARLAELGIK